MNILIVGVGGQGTLLASRIIGRLAVDAGLDVKMSEVHGMSQRGGSVVTYVRFDKTVFSPLIAKGSADVILAFEELETYRYIDYLKEGGMIIANEQKIMPMPVITGVQTYPEGLLERIKNKGLKLIHLDALEAARQAGNEKTVNVVLLGLLAKVLGESFSREAWLAALKATVPEKVLPVNLKAFDIGYGE